jgi:ubiquinol-cytochrome c reductase cytochrome b subunit
MRRLRRERSALGAAGRWLDERLGVRSAVAELARHPIPAGSASWFYALGSATLLCFAVLVVSGIALAVFYTPSADRAWQSLQHLTFGVPLGWMLRGVHYWASNFMVALLTLHAVQVFLFGAYVYPRELTWMVGVFLLLATLTNAFTGQIMRFDEDAYWGIGIGAAIAGRVPWIGRQLVGLLLGGPIVGGRTLSRFFALHVFLVPGLIGLLVLAHLRLVLRLGVSAPPVAGRPVDPATERQRYEEHLRQHGVPFFPNAAWRDLVLSGLVLIGIVACAALLGPKGPAGPPDPMRIDTVPRPDFTFLPLFALLALLPPSWETPVLLIAPPLAVATLLAIPLVAWRGERHPARRPVAVLCVVTGFAVLGVLAHVGATAPWSPHMQAWSSAPTPPEDVRGRTPLELQGALLVQARQCRNCHALGGVGGARGPALDGVATRLTHDQLVRQVLQGGGNMPAYGDRLAPEEVRALVAFLRTLGPPGGRARPPLERAADATSRGARDDASRGARDDAPRGARDDASRGARDDAPHRTTDAASP